MEKLSDLLELHHELDAAFERHQFALLHFDFAKAAADLDDYEQLLRTHMRDEEEVLMPIYAERAKIPVAGGVQLFLDEHEKMLAHLALFREQIEKLSSAREPEADLILLLDREAFYKRLSSHHDNRERGIFFPLLDSVTTPAERADILSRIHARPALTQPETDA